MAAIVAAVYCIFALAWIIGPELLTAALGRGALPAPADAAKGAGWVALSALLLFGLLRRLLRRQARRGRLPPLVVGAARQRDGAKWDAGEAQSLRERALLLGKLFESSPEGIALAGPERELIAANPAFERLLGMPAEALLGRSLDQALFDQQPRERLLELQQELDRHDHWAGRLDLARKGGPTRHAEVRISLSRDEHGGIAQYGALVSDVTELEYSRSALAYLQNYDSLTRLPNAQLIQQDLSDALRRTMRHRGNLAVMVVGLDRFHQINEAFGRTVGDQVLTAVAGRLLQARDAASYVGRLNGDRFALIAEQAAEPTAVESLVARVRTVLAPAFAADGHSIHVSASIGVARFPLDGIAAEQLLQRAESALEDAKRSGQAYRLYRAELSDIASSSVHIETNLREALLGGGFECHFQPQVRLQTGAWVGAEALMRWRLGDCWISPGRFIPIAEQSGVIKELGRWMLWDASSKVSEWRNGELIGDGFQVAVNLAGAQLEPELPRRIRGILNFNCLGRNQLVLELTENIIMSDPKETAGLLHELREMGVGIALDDFGSGNTSLSQLSGLPLDELKLDRAFVTGLPADQNAMAVARSVIELADALKLRVIAEGIETEAQREALVKLGCRYGQGHLFAAAMPAAAFEGRLRAQPRPKPARAREVADRS